MRISIKRRLAHAVFGGREALLLKAAYASNFTRLVCESQQARLVKDDVDLRRFLFEDYLDGEQLIYLEFGVYKGDSIAHVASLNQNSASRFIGFDSFEGLPEAWNAERPKGHFSTEGKAPNIGDSRVSFVKGCFNQSLPHFLRDFKAEGRIIINIDSDLFSSGLYVLITLDEYMTDDAIVMFDEFNDLLHEHRAFTDYSSVSGKRMTMVAASPDYVHVAFRLAPHVAGK
jgi:hypothetical protein